MCAADVSGRAVLRYNVPFPTEKVGDFDLAPGATLAIIPSESRGNVFADGFAIEPVP